ncbi:MAG: hypothetical protein IJA54_09560 [Tyzzerella sp.]|nr:hypothetical protein [Tyzzerella sp.]
MAFTVKLAGKIFHIEHIHPELEVFCKDYLVEESTPDFIIQLTNEDIAYEEACATEETFSAPYLETLALLRKISNILPEHKRFLMHGASISYEDNAFLFTARSGTGKSTHIRLWKKYIGDKVKIVNGDKPFISLEQNSIGTPEPMIYGTPWAGKERWQRNCSEPLKGICFVQRGTINTIQQMKPEECVMMLFNQVYMPEDSTAVAHTLELLDLLVKNVPFYLLTCDMSEEAVRCSFEALTGLPYPV